MNTQNMHIEDTVNEIDTVETEEATLTIQTGLKAGRMIRTMVPPPPPPVDLYI